MRFFSLFFLFFLCCTFSQAEVQMSGGQDSITIEGQVADAFSRETLADVDITISNGHGLVAFTTSVLYKAQQRGLDRRFYRVVLPHAGKYTFTYSKPGYTTKKLVIDIPKKKYMRKVTFWKVDEVLLSRHPSYQLGGVTVTASRIMMVEHGDTIVYNAAAFQLAEGSMLDALVAQLPGVKLDGRGRITYNGQFVEHLLVNGKDFFRGDPKVALDNLPAYMVNKIKVYRRESDEAYLQGERSENQRKYDPLVMDVNLKRQYSQGWIANIETALGTDHRHLGRFFGLRFTDHSRLSLYGNDNNINQTGDPNSNGNWQEEQTESGEQRTQVGGVLFSVDGKKSKIKFDTSFKGSYDKDERLTHTAATPFLATRRLYNRSFNEDQLKNLQLKWESQLFIPLKRLAIRFTPEASYQHAKNHHRFLRGSWEEEPFEAYRGAAIDSLFAQTSIQPIYKNRDLQQQISDNWDVNGVLRLNFKSPLLGRYTTFVLLGDIAQAQSDDYSQYLLQTTATKDKDFRHRYTDKVQKSHHWLASIAYPIFRNFGFEAILNYQYRHNYQSNSNSLYRLDWLRQGWDVPVEEGGFHLGCLPSTYEALVPSTDWSNTYRTLLMTQIHQPELSFSFFFPNGSSLNLKFPISVVRRGIRDFRAIDLAQRTAFHRHAVAFEPEMMFLTLKNFSLSYKRRFMPAPLSSMITAKEDSDPLFVYQGNKKLKDAWEDRLQFNYRLSQTKIRQLVSMKGDWWMQQNSIGMARQYDATTGVTFLSPRNMNGNWGGNASFSYERAIGSKQRVQLKTNTRCSYTHCVDFVSDVGETAVEAQKSSVNTTQLSETLQSDYRKGKFYLGLRLSAIWNHATSSRDAFSTINAVDMATGMVCTTPLIGGIHLSTDFTYYAHRGYQLSAMNTNDFIWNASLSRSFLRHKNLMVKLTAYDILSDLSALHYSINAQGRTETWTNALRRYAMLHLIYRLDIQPKKK